jgi:hypothetical protein
MAVTMRVSGLIGLSTNSRHMVIEIKGQKGDDSDCKGWTMSLRYDVARETRRKSGSLWSAFSRRCVALGRTTKDNRVYAHQMRSQRFIRKKHRLTRHLSVDASFVVSAGADTDKGGGGHTYDRLTRDPDAHYLAWKLLHVPMEDDHSTGYEAVEADADVSRKRSDHSAFDRDTTLLPMRSSMTDCTCIVMELVGMCRSADSTRSVSVEDVTSGW